MFELFIRIVFLIIFECVFHVFFPHSHGFKINKLLNYVGTICPWPLAFSGGLHIFK